MADEHPFLKPLLPDRDGAPQKSRHELLTLIQGIVADGVVVETEAEFLRRWITENESVRNVWPASVLYARIGAMLSDGVLAADEQHELLVTMQKFVESRRVAQLNREAVDSLLAPPTSLADLPFDEPEPAILHPDRCFVLTGEFASARRTDVERRITGLGGMIEHSVTRDTNYLVVGSLGSERWEHESYGPEVERAIWLREQGVEVRIVREEHWFSLASIARRPA